jgi:hypothetical protein
MHFDHLDGAPSQVVSQLMLTAYMDNFDYFYVKACYFLLFFDNPEDLLLNNEFLYILL